MPAPNSGDTEGGVPPPPRAEEGRGEFAAIDRLAARLARAGAPPPGEVWIGDDAAVLAPPEPGARLLLTTDVSVAGVHGDLALISAADFGWRALVASVSDIAAMGGRCRQAVVAVTGGPGTPLDAIYEGIAEASRSFGCPVVGGDLSGGRDLTVAVAVVGDVPAGEDPVRRDGARPGDALFVTGPLGASAAGLRRLRARSRAHSHARARPTAEAEDDATVLAHRRPVPRLSEGETARRCGVRAMIDVSDGLVADLGHVAAASGVGFELDDIPCAPGATPEEAVGGGEDYELVLATPDPEGLVAAFARAGLRRPIAIGRCVAATSVRTLQGAPLPAAGWEHPFATG
ncbi:MAG: thiamine-phosphate kinase [Acidimicrobiales bacterium]